MGYWYMVFQFTVGSDVDVGLEIGLGSMVWVGIGVNV